MYALKAIPMNQEENTERQAQESRYRDSQDDVSAIRRELNKLTGAVGEMVDCLKGNEFGNEGLVKQVRQVKELADKLNDRMNDWELNAKLREKAWRIVFLVLGTTGGVLIKYIIDRITPFKK